MAFTTFDELAKRISRRRAVELFDDDGDGLVAGDDLVTAQDTAGAAHDEVVSIIFKKGFDLGQVAKLEADRSLRRYATDIFAQLAGERRAEFLNDQGKGPYDALGERARATLKMVAAGELRSRLEDDASAGPDTAAGANPIVGGETSTGTPVFIVSRDPNIPGSRGPGGF